MVSKKTPLEIVSPTQTKLGELDDDDDQDDEDEDADENENEDFGTDQPSAKLSKRLEESKEHEENVRDEDNQVNISRSSVQSNSQKKNLRDLARKLWLAVE